ncbi:sugar phosphate isomerase/epimerase family protein [Singulisphaera acidiphila]|uniref:Sugar phosphate isomerase/epimerase n=1 Tax=Singulisphaera acidiphila (strain ATCC BAA-1392 / DSM 18658 / VKM B-2454 / MOB10) TaxID=886293 RepID=L0DQV9_SINAD|nr:sugar phosphate isomerase/epimerase [Singulisphaera acidiphila]AGA31370.1 sugar phosphate isomerase/epimerase [Singulisphaera acidiphila DSM 18658]
MFVACNTLCFSNEPLESALRHIAELEFDKIDLAIVENSPHLRPSEVAENPEAALHRLRRGPSLTPAALGLDFGEGDLTAPLLRKRFEAMCRLAKPLTVAVLTIPAAPLGTSFDDEVKRLSTLAGYAMREGLVLAVETHSKTLTADPKQAVELCKAIPGLGLTLDPSHYIQGPHNGADFDEVYPYVQSVHLRDTGKNPGEFQVRVGQGEIEYNRVVNQLVRVGYDRALTVSILDLPENNFEVEVEVRKLKLLLESLL